MIRDYRNTEYCKKFTKISRKKSSLIKLIKKEHPRMKIDYNIIKKNYKEKFYHIYNEKCAYCGASLKTIGIDRLEIDHFINEASFGKNKEKAGKITNLVTACYACNRRKSSFFVKNPRKFNPDFKNFKKLFYRNSEYEIKIFYKYKNDEEVIEFYNTLKLGSEHRRIDFLLLRYCNLIEKTKDEVSKLELQSQYYKLLQKK